MAQIEWIARALAVQDNHLLLCRHVRAGYRYLPGGHIEFGEHPAAALRRELLEETGLDVVVRACCAVADLRFHQHDRPTHEVNVVFHVEPMKQVWPASVQSLEPKIAFDWVPIAELSESAFLPQDLIPLITDIMLGEVGVRFLAAPA